MTHRLFAKTVAAGLIVMVTVAGTARAQGGDENRTITKLQIPQIMLANTMTQPNRAAAAELRSMPAVRPPQPYTGAPNTRNSHSRQMWSGVAFGLMGLIVGASIGDAIDRQCRCGGDLGMGGAISASVGATLGATFGVRLGR